LQLGFKLNKPQVWFCSPHPSSQYAIRPAPNPPIDTSQGWKETHLTIHYPVAWRSLSDYRSVALDWYRGVRWCQLRISGHVDDATALLPPAQRVALTSDTTTLWTAARAHNSRPLLSQACIQYKSSKTICDLYAGQLFLTTYGLDF